MKLEQEELVFIDTYLKNSGIEFLDLRLEMVDHVASGVLKKMDSEKVSFYEAFKGYMVVHKKELFQWDKKFREITDKKMLGKVGSQFLSPWSLVVFCCCLLLIKVGASTLNLVMFLKYVPFTLLLALVSFYYFTYWITFKKNGISGLERIGLLLIVPSQAVQLFFSHSYSSGFFQVWPTVYFGLISLVLVMTLAFLKSIYQLKKEYFNYFQTMEYES
jgi:hypothetical protein